MAAASAEHLKKRTRSGIELDRDLYKRYASPAAGGHVPVMLGEVLDAFPPSLTLRSFVDCTLGAGGHSAAIIEAHNEMQMYLGLDIDSMAHAMARHRIEALLDGAPGLKAYTHVRNFKYIKSVLTDVDENLLNNGVDGILMDLGMSSMQVNNSERGFSVLADGPLDMRMDPQASLKAEDILNSWPQVDIGRILRDYGEESNWNYLSKMIVDARAKGGLHSTSELVDLVRKTSARSGGRQGWIKTATRVFQALRIAVNDELRTLEDALYACFDCLSCGGRLAVISFHSLEDRIVKRTFLNLVDKVVDDADIDRKEMNKEEVQDKKGHILTKRPITPTQDEERLNRKCRSAKLRIIQKL
ncbi:LOW QUALITY PROTEIN: ribosomal RNA small subunit methyltransferase H [Dioscorea cayenensis subsp. rotundata]|uniref:LOW QUALITY PROTEIN: ribosomal RNA small subunit methyltransferase H n=1 Tax=Dioscorea cayennensis subsp. rotundata TaxID=55577 RepID=A0AB40D598_DIOCR|nr:LOW QUALITY PROTEIN: ribosomal RNA small subunit methyltransferase H [Dioscorea cayenensis subsp. rotundata]